jgi:hypothetical protein
MNNLFDVDVPVVYAHIINGLAREGDGRITVCETLVIFTATIPFELICVPPLAAVAPRVPA